MDIVAGNRQKEKLPHPMKVAFLKEKI